MSGLWIDLVMKILVNWMWVRHLTLFYVAIRAKCFAVGLGANWKSYSYTNNVGQCGIEDLKWEYFVQRIYAPFNNFDLLSSYYQKSS